MSSIRPRAKSTTSALPPRLSYGRSATGALVDSPIFEPNSLVVSTVRRGRVAVTVTGVPGLTVQAGLLGDLSCLPSRPVIQLARSRFSMAPYGRIAISNRPCATWIHTRHRSVASQRRSRAGPYVREANASSRRHSLSARPLVRLGSSLLLRDNKSTEEPLSCNDLYHEPRRDLEGARGLPGHD